ncbi:MAG: proton-conducting transporter membrane subunit, partial [Candidatus Omnitrophica bacterium]|nr:proton-conducting transporter membrane subunit [Candidatus Omnitrophota bacterium]
EYMREYPEKDEFYFWTVLFVGAMMGLIFSNQLLLMYCFWEITAICSWKLIGFYRREEDNKSAQRAFLTTFLGASLFLLGIIILYFECNTLDLNPLKGKILSNLIAGLFLCGILSKSAQLPFQSWLPDAGVAPTPVTALLHAAVLVKIGVYAFIRLFNLTFEVLPSFQYFCLWLGVSTILVSAGCALKENNMKRILAYSTISQLGYIIVISSFKTELAFRFTLLYILAHSLAKAGLFLCVGIVENKSGTKDITKLGGLLKTMPLTGLAYILSSLSIIGLPPFLGFWPKVMTILITAQHGYFWLTTLLVVGAIFTLLYLTRLFHYVFGGDLKIKIEEEKRSIMVYVCLLLGILSLLLGIFIKVFLRSL